MGATADTAASQRSPAARLGIQAGSVVQELGYDDDCDEDLRSAVVAAAGSALVAADVEDVVDVVMLWWRDGDGDLVDALVDALGPLGRGGVVWLLTPKSGRDGHVEPSDIKEDAATAGLTPTSTLSAGRDWSASRLVARGTGRR